MWSLIFSIPGLVQSFLNYLNKKQDIDLEKYKVDGQIDMTLVQAQATIIAAERPGLLSVQSARAAFAWIAVLYFGKVVAYDKVFAYWTHGSTDEIRGQTAVIMGVVLTGVFALGSFEKVVKEFRR